MSWGSKAQGNSAHQNSILSSLDFNLYTELFFQQLLELSIWLREKLMLQHRALEKVSDPWLGQLRKYSSCTESENMKRKKLKGRRKECKKRLEEELTRLGSPALVLPLGIRTPWSLWSVRPVNRAACRSSAVEKYEFLTSHRSSPRHPSTLLFKGTILAKKNPYAWHFNLTSFSESFPLTSFSETFQTYGRAKRISHEHLPPRR